MDHMTRIMYLNVFHYIFNYVFLVSSMLDIIISIAIIFVVPNFWNLSECFQRAMHSIHNVVVNIVFSGFESGIGSEWVNDNYIFFILS